MIKKIYLHWTAGRYGQTFDDYHICIDKDGSLQFMGELGDKKAHTWMRNSNAIGIALECAYNARIVNFENGQYVVDFGEYPPTEAQIKSTALTVAILCKVFHLDIDKDVLTHAEVATLDGYGVGSGDSETKWDLLLLPNGEPGGEYIRDLAKGRPLRKGAPRSGGD